MHLRLPYTALLVSSILLASPRSSTAQYAGIHDEGFLFSIPTGWQLVPKSHNSEFIPKGDDVNSWKELITVQIFDRKAIDADSPDAYLDSLKALREKECRSQTLWNVIQRDPWSILYEFQLTADCAGAPPGSQAVEQHEIARVVYGKYGVFILHYAAKGPGLTQDARATWIDRLWSIPAMINADIDQVIPFTPDQTVAALKLAMQSVHCEVKEASSSQVDCKRPRQYSLTTSSGGEKVTAALESQGAQTHVRITTGFGFVGNTVKENWSYAVFHEMMNNLHKPPTGDSAQ